MRNNRNKLIHHHSSPRKTAFMIYETRVNLQKKKTGGHSETKHSSLLNYKLKLFHINNDYGHDHIINVSYFLIE